MGVKILKREYINQFKPSSTTTWELGNVGDILKVSLECEFSVSHNFTNTDSLTIADPNTLTLNSGKTWKSLGFDVGFTCTLVYYVTDTTVTNPIPQQTSISFIIESLLDNVLTAKNPSGAPITTWSYGYSSIAPISLGTKEVSNVYVYSDKPPEGIQLEYSQVENSLGQTGTLLSHLDGTTTKMRMEDTGNITIGQIPTPEFTHYLEFQSGMSVVKGTVEYLGSQAYKYVFRIELIYMISTFYEEITDYEDNTAPSWVLGAKSITDMIKVIGYPTYNNPNIQISNDPKQTFQLGNTGWFGENFNQLPNPFTFTPVVYKNLAGTTVSQLDYVNPIVMTTTISGIQNLSGFSKFQYGFQWATINPDNWKKVIYPYQKNTKISTGGKAEDMGDVFNLSSLTYDAFPALRSGYSRDGLSGMDVSDIKFSQNATDATAVDVSLTFRPSTAFAAEMSLLSEEERKYIIWVSVGDQVPETNLGDRVSLKLDFNKLDTYKEPIGEFPGLTIGFLDHPQDETGTPRVLNNWYVEDGALAKVNFTVNTAVGDTIPIVEAINFGVLVKSLTDGSTYELDSTKVDLSSYPDATQYNYDVTRDFKLAIGNNKNFLKVSYDAATTVGTEIGAIGWYGFKMRWEDWKERFPHAPIAFYNNSYTKNGFNQDWYEYFSNAGYSLQFFVDMDCELAGDKVTYRNLKEIALNDYDSNATISTSLLYYADNAGAKGALISGGTYLGLPLGVIVKDSFVWLDIEYTSTGTPWIDQADVDANYYGISEIGVENGGGQKDIRQLSSIYLPEFGNPLLPISPDTKATVTFNATNKITVSCRIEANKLITADIYKVTGKIGGK
tara:strand:+ start:368 stop:2881 length:2514 start_codon:yes stop_codon:yes gene_type:complete